MLKSNYPDSRYTELRKAVDFAIKVLEKEKDIEGDCPEFKENYTRPTVYDEALSDYD